MRKVFLVAFIIIISNDIFGQQLSQYSQYMFNKFIINPAVAGSDEKIPIMASIRRQWVGIKDAPVTQTLSAHAYVGQQIGIGLNLYNDVTGPTRRTGISFAGARHIQIDKANDSWLSLGLSGIFFQYAIDQSKLTLDQPNDPALNSGNFSKFLPDAAAGAFYYTRDYYIGLSAQHLIQSRLNLFDVNTPYNNQVLRTYFFNSGYDFYINDYFTLEPSVLVKYTRAAPVQLDVNTKVYFKERVWLGASYRTSDAVVVLAGVNTEKIYFGYSYDITTNRLRNYSSGSHELFLGIRLDNAISKDGHHTRHYSGMNHKNQYKRPHHR